MQFLHDLNDQYGNVYCLTCWRGILNHKCSRCFPMLYNMTGN